MQSRRRTRDGEAIAFRFQLKPEKHGLSFTKFAPARPGRRRQRAAAPSEEAAGEQQPGLRRRPRAGAVSRALRVGSPQLGVQVPQPRHRRGRAGSSSPSSASRSASPSSSFAAGPARPATRFSAASGSRRPRTQRYDQPVIMRLNVRDENELNSGGNRFRLPEDLYGYHAVILDDVEAEFFHAGARAAAQQVRRRRRRPADARRHGRVSGGNTAHRRSARRRPSTSTRARARPPSRRHPQCTTSWP